MVGDLAQARRALETFTSKNHGHRHLETAWPYLGDVYLRLGDVSKAKQAYEQSLRDFPQGRLADRSRFGLGRALALDGDTEPALKVLRPLAERGGSEWTDRAWVQVGQLLAGSGQKAAAVEAFATLERVAPRSPLVAEARLGRAEALMSLGRRDEAEPLLRGLMGENPGKGDPGETTTPVLAARAALILGTDQLDRGAGAEALATLDDARKRWPRTSWTAALWFRSAEAARQLGQLDDARARFLKVAEVDPNDPWAADAWLRAASLALDARDRETARRLASEFAGRFPSSKLRADAHLIEARAELADGRPREAIALLNDARTREAPNPETAAALLYYLGLSYHADGQLARESEVFETLARDPNAPFAADALFMLGQGHVEAGRFAEAIAALEKYQVAKPDGDVADHALAHLATARLELGQTEAAEAIAATLAERFPASKALAPTRLRLAGKAAADRRFDAAANGFRQALSAAEQASDRALVTRARSGLGWALLEGGKPGDAAEVFGTLLADAPQDSLAPAAALGRARGIELAGKSAEAVSAYAFVSATYPRSSQADTAALARARLLVESGHPEQGSEAYAQLVAAKTGAGSIDSPLPGGLGRDGLLAEWGWALIDARKTEAADAVFTRLLDEFPASRHADDARFNLAESAYQARNYDRVAELLAPLAAPGSPSAPKLVEPALYRLGRTQVARKQWADAGRTFERLEAGFPTSPYRREARFWRAEAAQRDRRPENGRGRLRRAVGRAGRSGRSRRLRPDRTTPTSPVPGRPEALGRRRAGRRDLSRRRTQ